MYLPNNLLPIENEIRFRKMINREFMKDFYYECKGFTFKTVFHLTAYSYRCCPCSYEFEYLDFLSGTGEINQPMYQNLLQSLRNKECPHAEGEAAELVKVTQCRGFHIVAALEDEAVLQHLHKTRHIGDSTYGPSGLFGITPCHMAVLKGKPKSLDIMLDIYPCVSEEPTFKLWYRSEEDRNNIRFEESNFLDQCVRKNNIPLLKSFISWIKKKGHMIMDLSGALNFAIVHVKTADILNILMRNMKRFGGMDSNTMYGPMHVIECAEMVTILNEYDILENLLDVVSFHYAIDACGPKLSDLCVRLPRPKCKEVAEKYEISCKSWEPVEETVHGLLDTLVKFPYCGTGYDEMVAILKSIPGIRAVINSEDTEGYTELQKFLKPKPRSPETKILEQGPNPKIIGLLFDLGADINKPFTNGESPLKFLLHECVILDDRIEHYMYKNVRQTIELLLHENPSLEETEQDRAGSASLTKLALLLDSCFTCYWNGVWGPYDLLEHHPAQIKMTNSVITDSHHTADERYALNFLLPLLIECGYRATRADLLKVDSERFEQVEFEYIQRVLHINRPRDLTLICRDSLRKHFKGRKLWYYLERNHVPKRLKDFILLKHELLMLNGQ